MIADICVSLWQEAKRAVAPSRRLSTEDIRQLVHETLTSATMIAVAASGLNAAARGHAGRELAEASIYLPDTPTWYLGLEDEGEFTAEAPNAFAALDRLYAAVDAARESLQTIADSPTLRERQSRIGRQKAVLQELCGLALAALTEVEMLASSARVPPDLRLPNAVLLLKSARDGGVPCLGADGRLSIPEWLQRRGRQRWPVRFTIDIVSDRSADVATVLDISPTGFGIACFGSFRKGDAVTMRVPDGRMLHGTIVWRQMRRAGVRLDESLDSTDPLLGAAYRVLERRV